MNPKVKEILKKAKMNNLLGLYNFFFLTANTEFFQQFEYLFFDYIETECKKKSESYNISIGFEKDITPQAENIKLIDLN